MIFIDANQYLQLYQTVSGKKLLAPLREHTDQIFITRQIVNEVERNKLEVATRFLHGQLQQFCLRSMALPDLLFGIDDTKLTELRRRVGELSDNVKTIKAELDELASKTLTSISRSEDDVSIALKGIFAGAVRPTNDEMNNARLRQEIGNPPGKKGDPLGDQLSWEQFITRAIGRPSLWVISNDSDYLTMFGQSAFLNPLLLQDLQFTCGQLPEVYAFNNLMKGLDHFVRESGLPRGSLPTGSEAAQIEEDFLANYYCGSLWLTHGHGENCESLPLSYDSGIWACPKVNLVIRRDRILMDGQTYPVQSLRPFLADFAHNGQQFTITE